MPRFGTRIGIGASRSQRRRIIAGGGEPPPPAPSIVTAPVVTGIPFSGRQLTVSPGVWNGSPTARSYQWQRVNQDTGAVTNVGTDSTSYTVQPADEFAKLRCRESASNAGGAANSTSATTSIIAAGIPTSLVGLGDSVMLGLNANSSNTDVDMAFAWCKQLANALGLTFVNNGVGSRSLARQTQAANTNTVYNGIFDAGQAIGANKRDAVIIAAGGIDAFQGASYNNVANYQAFYRRILSKLLASGYTRKSILIADMYPIFDAGLAQQGINRTRWNDFNAAAIAIAREHGLILLDFQAIPLVAADVSFDNIHPTRIGHTKIQAQILNNPAIITLPNPKPPITNLVMSATGGTISATWDAVPDRIDYTFRLLDGVFHQPQGTQTIAANAASVSGVPAGTYYGQVVANLAGGVSTPIAQASVVVT